MASEINGWLSAAGLTYGRAIGFAITILTALWAASAARSSSRESKRQHHIATRSQKLSAAGTLILSLNKLQSQLEDILYDNTNCSQMFDHHTSLDGCTLPENSHELAAKMGELILTNIINLEIKLADAKMSISSTGTILGQEDAEADVTRHCAALTFDTVTLSNLIAIDAGKMHIAKPSMEPERLRKLADGSEQSMDD